MPGRLSALVDERAAAGHAITGIATDVTRAEDVERCVETAMQSFGRVDAFINNAGVEGVVAPIEAYPEAEFDKVMGVNVRGVFLGMKHAIPALRASGGGSIVNLASVAGLSGGARDVGLQRLETCRYRPDPVRRGAARSGEYPCQCSLPFAGDRTHDGFARSRVKPGGSSHGP